MVDSIQGFGSLQSMFQTQSFSRPKTLTDEQKSQIKSILSNYDSSNVTASDAKAIFQAFRDAGINPGPGMRETIEEAGFDAEELRSLGMPEGVNGAPPAGGRPPGPPPGGMVGGSGSTSGSQGINMSALQELQSILSQFDLTNLTDDEKESLFTQLTKSGLMRSGSLVDLGV